MINEYIAALAQYGLKTGLITPDDRIFAVNSILAILGLDDYEADGRVEDCIAATGIMDGAQGLDKAHRFATLYFGTYIAYIVYYLFQLYD